jgi:hypothetical protein
MRETVQLFSGGLQAGKAKPYAAKADALCYFEVKTFFLNSGNVSVLHLAFLLIDGMVRPFDFPALKLVPLFSADFLTVAHAAGHRYLEARWSRLVSSEEFRQGIQMITDSISEHGVELLLIDFRLSGTPSTSDQGWLVKRLMAAYQTTPLRRSARLLSMDILQQMVSEIITEKVENFPYELQVFHSDTLAKQWLFRAGASK